MTSNKKSSIKTRKAEHVDIVSTKNVQANTISTGFKDVHLIHKSLPEKSIVFVFDPTHVAINGQQRYFYYEVIDDSHYYLLGVGADKKPYTNDDILPNIDIKKNSKIGLLIHEGSKR